MKKTVLFTLALLSAAATAKDLGFRYNDGVCKNAEGKQGLNPGYLGQCADLRNVTLLRFNLEDTDFSGSDFTSSDLQQSSFKNSVLHDTKFTDTILSGVVFDMAKGKNVDFVRATLINTHFAGAMFESADFSGADFSGGQLSYLAFLKGRFVGAQFNGATMDHIDLSGANLSNANLKQTIMTGAILDGAQIDAADFEGTDLHSASLKFVRGKNVLFRGTNLRNASLEKANIESSNFRRATLEYAYLKDAKVIKSDLRAAYMKNAMVDGADLSGSTYNKHSELPFDNEKAAERGMIFVKASDLFVLWDYQEDGLVQPPADLAELKKFLEENGSEMVFAPVRSGAFEGNQNLSEYGAVLHLHGVLYYVDLPASGQTALVDYVKGGGVYLGTQWIAYSYEDGMLQLMSDLVLTNYGGSEFENELYRINDRKSAPTLLTGVEDFSMTEVLHSQGKLRSFDENPAVSLMDNGAGIPRIAYRNFGSGHIINFSFPVTYAGRPLSNPSIQKIILNALNL